MTYWYVRSFVPSSGRIWYLEDTAKNGPAAWGSIKENAETFDTRDLAFEEAISRKVPWAKNVVVKVSDKPKIGKPVLVQTQADKVISAASAVCKQWQELGQVPLLVQTRLALYEAWRAYEAWRTYDD